MISIACLAFILSSYQLSSYQLIFRFYGYFAFTTYFQKIHPFFNICSAVFSYGVGRKNRTLFLFQSFFYSILVNILAETASVNLNSFVVVMYIYILSMVSAVCPFKSYISSWVLFFQLPAFVEFLKDKPVKLYIRVFIIYPVHT